MALKTLSSPEDLLRAGGTAEIASLLSVAAPGQTTYFNPKPSEDRECDAYIQLLLTHNVNTWHSSTFESSAIELASGPLYTTPYLRLGIALDQKDCPESAFSFSGKLPSYIVVIRDLKTTHKFKLLICDGAKSAVEVMYYELINGFSVTFCAMIDGSAGKLLRSLSHHDPEGLRKTITFKRIGTGVECYKISNRKGREFRPTQMREMREATQTDVEVGPLSIGFIN